MVFTKKQLTDYIFSEVKKIIEEENNIISKEKKSVDIVTENLHEIFEEVEVSLSKPEISEDTDEDTDAVIEAKKLSEEFKRMKQLVDFRSPLLIKD